MNLFWAWELEWHELLVANLVPFTTTYRPFGGLLYRAVYEAFGLAPLPYRVVVYVSLGAYIASTAGLAFALTRSRFVATLSALGAAYHSRFLNLYSDGGLVYDALCAALSLGFLAYHASRLPGSTRPGGAHYLLSYAVFVAALNTKEIAATLPLILLTWELWQLRLGLWASHSIRRYQATRRIAWPLFLSALALAAFVGKTAPGTPIHNHAGYQQLLSAQRVSSNIYWYWTEMFYGPETGLSAAATTLVAIVLLILFALPGSRSAPYLLPAFLLAPLPLLIIPLRDFSSMLIPFAALAIVSAERLDTIGGRLPRETRWAPIALAFAALSYAHYADRKARPSIPTVALRHDRVASFLEQTAALAATLQPGDRIVVLNSRFGSDYTPMFFLELSSGLRDIYVGIPGANQPPRPNLRDFDIVLYDRDGVVRHISPKRP